MSNDLLQKIVDTDLVGSANGGILNPEQASRFIDYTWDATVLGQYATRRPMSSPVVDVDSFRVGQRIAQVATEGIDDGTNATPTFSKVSLTTTKIRLDWELTSESLEDNIAGDDLEDQLMRAMATQLGNDVEDVAISGDSASSDPLLKAFDGYVKRAKADANVLSHNGDFVNADAFSRAYKALPRQYKTRRDQLRFFTGSGLAHDYRLYLQAQGINDMNFEYLQAGQNVPGMVGDKGETGMRPFGINLVEVPLFDESQTGTYIVGDAVGDADPTEEYHGDIHLTHPDNMVWGVMRDITLYSQFAQKKDSLEFTVYTRQGVVITNPEAWVVVQDVRDRAV